MCTSFKNFRPILRKIGISDVRQYIDIFVTGLEEEIVSGTNGNSSSILKPGTFVYTFIGTELICCRVKRVADEFSCLYIVTPKKRCPALKPDVKPGVRKTGPRSLQIRLHPLNQVISISEITSNRDWGLSNDLRKEVERLRAMAT